MCTFRLVSLFLALQIILYCLFLCSQNSILTYSYLRIFRTFLVVLLIVLCLLSIMSFIYFVFCLYSSLFLFLIFFEVTFSYSYSIHIFSHSLLCCLFSTILFFKYQYFLFLNFKFVIISVIWLFFIISFNI